MSGISKHYILHMKDDVKVIDKKIVGIIYKYVTQKVTNTITEPARAEFTQNYNDIMIPIGVPWRKQMLGLWELAKKVTKQKNPWGYRLVEYRVRRGRGVHKLDGFKEICRNYRAFSAPKKKPETVRFEPYRIRTVEELAGANPPARPRTVQEYMQVNRPTLTANVPMPTRLADYRNPLGGPPAPPPQPELTIGNMLYQNAYNQATGGQTAAGAVWGGNTNTTFDEIPERETAF
jgi:hypothetical protein